MAIEMLQSTVTRLGTSTAPEPPGAAPAESPPVSGTLPAEFVLGALRHPQLRLREPVRLQVAQEDDWVTVWHAGLEELGYGAYLTAAVEDFQQTVAELYWTLKADRDRLGPDLARLWQRLQHYIEERP